AVAAELEDLLAHEAVGALAEFHAGFGPVAAARAVHGAIERLFRHAVVRVGVVALADLGGVARRALAVVQAVHDAQAAPALHGARLDVRFGLVIAAPLGRVAGNALRSARLADTF